MHFYCDCKQKDHRQADNKVVGVRGKFKETCVDDDDVCIYCGYMAIASKNKLGFNKYALKKGNEVNDKSNKSDYYNDVNEIYIPTRSGLVRFN